MKATLATPLFLALLGSPALAEDLSFTVQATITLADFSHSAVGDITFETMASKLWVCNALVSGQVYEVSLVTGLTLSQFSPASIPGLALGPDALAIPNTAGSPDVFVFSSFGESEGGRVTQTGALVNDFGTSHGATGADFDAAGNLWIATGTVAGAGSTLRRINPVTGAVLQVVPILANSARVVDLTFDPVTNACYCLLEGSNLLVEVSTSTGAQLSQTDLTPYLPGSIGINGGLDFDRFGQFLYVGGFNSNQIRVLRRDFDRTICDGTGASTACPCGNVGQPGKGCDNSFATGGARLDSLGLPSVAFDDLTFTCDGMPPTTTCLFFQGTTTPESVPAVFGDGLRCVVGTVIRLGTKTTSGGAASYPGPSDPLVSVRGAIPVGGATRFYQVWYRNVAAFCTPSGFNLSNALRIRWQ